MKKQKKKKKKSWIKKKKKKKRKREQSQDSPQVKLDFMKLRDWRKFFRLRLNMVVNFLLNKKNHIQYQI